MYAVTGPVIAVTHIGNPIVRSKAYPKPPNGAPNGPTSAMRAAVVSLPICPGRLRAGNGAQRKARKQEGVKLKSAMRRRSGKFELAN